MNLLLRRRWAGAQSGVGRLRLYVIGIVLLAAATVYFTTRSGSLNLYVFDRVLLVSIGAIALNLLMGTAGQLSMGNAGFLLIGSMSSVYFLRMGVPFPFDVLLAAAFCGLIGGVVAIPALRLKSFFLALATLALHFVATFAANRYQASDPNATYSGFPVKILFASSGIDGSHRKWAYLLLVVLSGVAFLAIRLSSERTGRSWRMLRDHEHVAQSFGISVKGNKFGVFVFSSALIGVEAGLLAHFTGTVNAEAFTLIVAIQYIAMILIGGQDRVVGAIIGAAIITALPVFVPRWVGSIIGVQRAATQGPQISQMIYGLLIIVFITASPDGVAGWAPALTRRVRRRVASADGRGLPALDTATPSAGWPSEANGAGERSDAAVLEGVEES